MNLSELGLIHSNSTESIERVTYKGMEVDLLASYDGTEVIKLHLYKGARWGLGPIENWKALEFLYLLSGELRIVADKKRFTVKSGDNISFTPIKGICIFEAIEEATFLYISSKPVFHHFSKVLDEYKQLGISVEEKDGYTYHHCERIMKISMLLGEKLNLSSFELYQLNIGSFLHDVGKINIPDEILQKPGKLTEDEWALIKKHPSDGAKLLNDSGYPFLIDAAIIVEQHHERHDGSGYPYGLKGEEILTGSAIVAVVDSYDAMTTDRVYRKALTHEEAIAEIIKGSGSLYHPSVVQAFISIKDYIKTL